MGVLPLEPMAMDYFQWEFLCLLWEKTHFLLEIHSSQQCRPQCLSAVHLTSADTDFVGHCLASLQEMHSGASSLLLGLKTSGRLTLIDDYGKSRLGYWLLLCFKDHRAY